MGSQAKGLNFKIYESLCFNHIAGGSRKVLLYKISGFTSIIEAFFSSMSSYECVYACLRMMYKYCTFVFGSLQTSLNVSKVHLTQLMSSDNGSMNEEKIPSSPLQTYFKLCPFNDYRIFVSSTSSSMNDGLCFRTQKVS